MNWMEKAKIDTATRIQTVNLEIEIQATLNKYHEEEIEYLLWCVESAQKALTRAEDDLERDRTTLRALQQRRQRLVVAAKQAGWTDIIS